jgi:ABC-type sugar transport system permease subunit
VYNLKIRDDNYKKNVKIFIVTVFIFLISLTLSAIFSPPKESVKSIINGLPKNITHMKGIQLIWDYIIQNGLKLPLQMFILALIPIPFIYSIILMISSVAFGVIFVFLLHLELKKKGIIMTLSAIPHVCIEILAMSFMASGLYMLNKAIVRKITNKFKKNKKKKISFKLSFINVLKIYLLRALPLFILASVIEAYFPHFFIKLFY